MGHQSKIPISTDDKSIWTVLLYFCTIHIVIRSIFCVWCIRVSAVERKVSFCPFLPRSPLSLSQKIDARKLRCRRKCHLGHSRSPALQLLTWKPLFALLSWYGKFVASYHPFTRANILARARGTMQECYTYHPYFSFCRRFKTRHPSTFPAASLHLKANSDFFRILWCRK